MSSSGCNTPVEVSPWTSATSLVRPPCNAASIASGSMTRPHSAFTGTTSAPQRSAISISSRPKRPHSPTTTRSPGSTSETIAASRPARPVPDTGNARSFRVWNAKRQRAMTSFMIAVNSGSNCPRRGAAIALSTRGSAVLGPGPSRMRGPGTGSPDGSVVTGRWLTRPRARSLAARHGRPWGAGRRARRSCSSEGRGHQGLDELHGGGDTLDDGRADLPGDLGREVGHAGAAEDDRVGVVFLQSPPALLDDGDARGRALPFEIQHGEVGRADVAAEPGHAVGLHELPGDAARALERRDDRESGGDHAGGVHRRFRDAQDGAAGDLARRQETGIAEARDDVAIAAVRLALADLLEEAEHADGLVVVALDGHGAHGRARRHDRRALRRHPAGRGADLLGHALGGVRIDHLDLHDARPFLAGLPNTSRRSTGVLGARSRFRRPSIPCRWRVIT